MGVSGRRRVGCMGGYVRECLKERGGIPKGARREGVLLSIVFHDFCQLPNCLKGLGCTIPFIHCSPTFTIWHRSTMLVISSSSRGYSLVIIVLHLLCFVFLCIKGCSLYLESRWNYARLFVREGTSTLKLSLIAIPKTFPLWIFLVDLNDLNR